MYGRARRGQRDYLAYLIKDGKERRSSSRQNCDGDGAMWSNLTHNSLVVR